ncbi:MAG TPA: lysozyme inhibitor LprI family protein [Rhizomicrobium sp.]|nr:lysozyme inhibitor LprI family protein [Rhizomicrobium sp.]
MSRPLIFALVLFAILSGHAEAARSSVCTHSSDSREEEACYQRALDDAQLELKKKYASVSALLGTKDRKEALSRSQKTWGLYVTQTCDGLVRFATQESKLARADVLSCKVELTRERTHDLDRMLYDTLHD